MYGYDLATDTENYGSGKATSTIYGSTPRYSNEGVDGEKEYRFDVFPDAIELCVPTATTELTMVIAAITEGWDFTFGEDNQGTIDDRKFIPSFTIMDEDGCLAAPAPGEACSDVYDPSGFNWNKQMPGAGASNHIFNFCPQWHSEYSAAEGSRAVTVHLRISGTCNKLSDLQDIDDPANAIAFPEVALMEAIQEGYGELVSSGSFSSSPITSPTRPGTAIARRATRRSASWSSHPTPAWTRSRTASSQPTTTAAAAPGNTPPRGGAAARFYRPCVT